MNKKLFIIFLTSIFLFYSCDLLRFSKFEVLSWSPGSGYQTETEKITISLSFSRDPNRASVERNFSLTEDGSRVKGSFAWDGKKVTFTPLTPLEKNADFILSLSADACDVSGLSMDEAFNRNFTTRPDNERPVLISYYPPMYAEISDSRMKVNLEFSIPVPIKALYDNVSFIPSMTGFWLLENDGRLAVFTPAEPWVQNSRYEIRISSSFTDINEMNIRNDFSSIFTTKTDSEIPYLLNALRITKENELIQLTPDKGYVGAAASPVENHDWEKDDKLSLVFSKPVDSITVKNYLSAEGGPNLVMETPPGFNSEYTFKFESIPAYESRFSIKIKPGIKDSAGNESKEEYLFRVFANGKYSKPPVLAGIRIPMAPYSEEDQKPVFIKTDSLFEIIPISDNYPSGESVKTWIELYFITADGAYIDLFSLMELFRIETTNNVITFSPRQMKAANFTMSDPHSEWENYQRIEITGNLTNTTNFGLINFLIAGGLKDSFGNRNENPQKISVIK